MFFVKILSTVKTPSLVIKWERGAPAAKYVHKPINLLYYVDLGPNEWPWPTELSADEFERILNGFSDAELAKFVAGVVDGDGTVRSELRSDNIYVYVEIAVCKDCPKKFILDVLKRVVAERFGIVGSIYSKETTDALVFRGEGAVMLLRRVVEYIHHLLRRLRAELILALYDGRISRETFERLYETTEYEYGGPDIKRN
ncbi:MAG: hypothetical protein RXP99_05180, partial [Vulcanisaeta sp.]